MNRSDRRKNGVVGKEPTYTVTKSQMIAMQEEYFQKGMKKAHDELKGEVVEDILVKLLGYPCMVLSKYYGWGMKSRLPGFVDHLMEEYNSDDRSIEEVEQWIFENVGIKFERE